MSWAQSLIKLSTFEVEELQKRLAEIVGRREALEMKLAVLEAEGEAETIRARGDAEAGWYLIGFREGMKARRAVIQVEIAATYSEEAGCRDALGAAFESQKKYEHVAEQMKLATAKERARIENQSMDEMGMRQGVRQAAARKAAGR
jgi:flagellar FliJ protein